uniref:Protein NRT1/ PTR FAMILY 6.1-like n=1 Tax=Nelumbo nucifera TaxID=4432 RepID=A0A822YIQ1_NELNU|nr:TPA_asm: hypothetical protein HUJ06_004714 [Nelumbo nucifera]
MESMEIKSPGDFPETPARLGGISDSFHRKKLGMYFIESDDRRTAMGGGYVGGTTPVNIRGKPITDLSKTGGWIAAFFIFGNEMAERMAYFGLSVNMVAFMFYVMHRPFSSSANAVNNFLGISQASSVLGGFLADAYLGRYWTIAIFTTIYLAVSRQGSSATERRWCRSQSLEALHCYTSRRGQDTTETPSNTSLHYNAQCNFDRILDSISPAGIYLEYPHGTSETPSDMYACFSWPQHFPHSVSLLLHLCPIVPPHYRSPPWCLSASKGWHWFGSLYLVCGLGWGFREIQKKLCNQARV